MEHQKAFRFDSLAALNAAPHGWDAQLTPLLGESPSAAALAISASKNVLINTVQLGDATLQRGSAPKGMRTFSLVQKQSREHIFRGHAIDLNTLIAIPRDRELYAVSTASIELLNFSIAEDLLFQAAERMEVPGKDLDNLPEAVCFSEGERLALQRQVEILSEVIVKYVDHSIAARLSLGLEEELICVLLKSVTDISRYGSKVRANKRYRVTRRAMDYILSHPRQPISSSELAEQAGGSRRTVEKGFTESIGMSPQQFIKGQRLRGCRADLHSRGEVSPSQVSSIASNWGFWHMGQFAADYHKFFGELPSQTSRRK